MPVVAIAAIAGTAYSIYAGERAHAEQKEQAEQAKTWQERQQILAEQRYQEEKEAAEEGMQRKFEAESEKYKRQRAYYSGVARDPRRAVGWGGYKRGIETEANEMARQVKAQARRAGTTGGAVESALRTINASKLGALTNRLYQSSEEAAANFANLDVPYLGVAAPSTYTAVEPVMTESPNLGGLGAASGAFADIALKNLNKNNNPSVNPSTGVNNAGAAGYFSNLGAGAMTSQPSASSVGWSGY